MDNMESLKILEVGSLTMIVGGGVVGLPGKKQTQIRNLKNTIQ